MPANASSKYYPLSTLGVTLSITEVRFQCGALSVKLCMKKYEDMVHDGHLMVTLFLRTELQVAEELDQLAKSMQFLGSSPTFVSVSTKKRFSCLNSGVGMPLSVLCVLNCSAALLTGQVERVLSR